MCARPMGRKTEKEREQKKKEKKKSENEGTPSRMPLSSSTWPWGDLLCNGTEKEILKYNRPHPGGAEIPHVPKTRQRRRRQQQQHPAPRSSQALRFFIGPQRFSCMSRARVLIQGRDAAGDAPPGTCALSHPLASRGRAVPRHRAPACCGRPSGCVPAAAGAAALRGCAGCGPRGGAGSPREAPQATEASGRRPSAAGEQLDFSGGIQRGTCPLPDLGTGDNRALPPRGTGTKRENAAESRAAAPWPDSITGPRPAGPSAPRPKNHMPWNLRGEGLAQSSPEGCGGLPRLGGSTDTGEEGAMQQLHSCAAPHHGGQLPAG